MLISLSNLARNQPGERAREAGVDLSHVKVSRDIFSSLYYPEQLSPFVGVVTESLYLVARVAEMPQSCAGLRSPQSFRTHT